MQRIAGLSAVQSLRFSHPGPVPAHLMDAARALDAARAADHASPQGARPARIRVGAVKLKPSTAIDLMASAMVEAFRARGLIEEADMARAGFTPAQIADYRDRAFARAILWEPRLAAIAGDASGRAA